MPYKSADAALTFEGQPLAFATSVEQKKVVRHNPSRPAEVEEAPGSSASFISRVRASASGLVQDAIAHPTPNAIVNDLNGSISSSAKGSEFGNLAGPSTSLIAVQNHVSAYPVPSSNAGIGHSFRSNSYTGSRSGATDDYDSFISLPSNPDQDRDWPTILPAAPIAEYSDLLLHQHASAIRSTFASPFVEGSWKHRPEEDPADGAAVVALLTDPRLRIEDVPEDPLALETSECNRGDVSSLSESIVTQNATDVLKPVNPLDLIPDFRDCQGKAPAERVRHHSSPRIPHEGGVDAPFAEVKRGEDFELQPWIDILTNYHDEIWGDSLPLVKDAVKEATVIGHMDDERKEEFQAIRRLAMLVGHVSHKVLV
ncbi:MAG: hypothetical protein Q9218_003272 [Villophora microphyllina]